MTKRYCHEKDILDLGWLPVKERTELHLLHFTYKPSCHPAWPECLKLELYNSGRQLHSSYALTLKIAFEKGTFYDNCTKLFNDLPVDLRSEFLSRQNLVNFSITLRNYLYTTAKDHLSLEI